MALHAPKVPALDADPKRPHLGPLPLPKRAADDATLIVGRRITARQVERALDGEGVRCLRVDDLDHAKAALRPSTQAVILAPPFRACSTLEASESLSASKAPLFIARRGETGEHLFESLRQSGVHAVFRWPIDRRALTNTITRIAAHDFTTRYQARPEDVALEEIVRSRLRADEVRFGKRLFVRVRNGLAILFGQLDQNTKVYRATHIAENVHGVDNAMPAGLEVAPHY